jgi:hypothetical protein
MVLIIILGYLGLATPLLIGLLRAATRGDRSAPVPERNNPSGSSMPRTLSSRAPAAQ